MSWSSLRDRDVLGDGHLGEEAQGFAILGDERDTRLDGVGGLAEAGGSAAEEDRPARLVGRRAEEGFEQFRPTGSEEPGDTDDLARLDVEPEVFSARADRSREGRGG